MTPTAQVKKGKTDKLDNIKKNFASKDNQKSEKVTYGI